MSQPSVFQTKTDLARRHIEGLILSRKVKPGDRITTREVSEVLGISETPIREAIRSLASEGWLEVHVHVGAVVASAGSEQLREIYALRGLIGALAIELGAASYDDRKFAEINANLAASAVAVQSQDVKGYIQLNYEFHMLLYDTPHTQWCLRMHVNLRGLTSAHYGFTITPGRMAASLKEHEGIRDAIRAGQFSRASSLIKEHEQVGYKATAKELESGRHAMADMTV